VPTQYRIQGSVNSAQGPALDGVEVYICTQPATTTTIPPSPLATLYTDSTGDTVLAQPVVTDGLGNWYAYLSTGTYTVVLYDTISRIPTTVYPDQQAVSPGGGSVTSVALTMDGVIFNATVSGSPVDSSGTFAPALLTQNANTVLAGPSSGASANPTFRSLVAADLPSVGSVSSVAVSTTGSSAVFSITVSGSPITGSGTIVIPINFVNFAANSFLAGPASGSAAAPTVRALTPYDIALPYSAAFSATITMDASIYNALFLTLTGNVTSFTVINPVIGAQITLVIAENSTGNWTFAYPANFKGYTGVEPTGLAVSVQDFIYDGTNWRAISPGNVNFT
jgi:hypothetical protein